MQPKSTIVTRSGKELQVRFSSLIISGLGRHDLSSSLRIERGITIS